MNRDSSLRDNPWFPYYPSGHMVYLNTDALKQLEGGLARRHYLTAPQY